MYNKLNQLGVYTFHNFVNNYQFAKTTKQINYTKLLKAHPSLKKNLILLRTFQFG